MLFKLELTITEFKSAIAVVRRFFVEERIVGAQINQPTQRLLDYT